MSACTIERNTKLSARVASVYGTRFAQVRCFWLYGLPPEVRTLIHFKGEKPLVHRMMMPSGQPPTEPVNLQISMQPVTDNIPSIEALVEKSESKFPTLENLIEVLRLLKTLSTMNTNAYVSTPPCLE